MEFEIPKFHRKNPPGSRLTRAPNRGTQQGFSRFYRLSWKSEHVEKEANAIIFKQKIAYLKLCIWTLESQTFIEKIPREVGQPEPLTWVLNKVSVDFTD